MSFPATLAAWEGLALGGPGRPVSGLQLTAGHLVLRLASGNAAPVVAGGEVVGLFFTGEGALEYTTDDPLERPVVEYNLAKNTHLHAGAGDHGLIVADRFDELLWLSGGGALPSAAPGDAGLSLERAFRAHLAKFGRVRVSPAAHEFTAWRLNAPEERLVRAELSGGAEDLLYELDGVRAKAEALFALRKSDLLPDRIIPTVLSSQGFESDGRSPVVPTVMLTAVDLALTASDGKDVTLSATETLTAVGRASSVLLLDLLNTVVGRDYLDLRQLKLNGVFNETGQPLPFDHAGDEVAVGLPAPLAPGASVRLRFELQGDVLHRPAGDSYWMLGTYPWFPQPSLSGQYYTVHATAKVRKPFVPLMPGTTVRRGTDGDWNVLETRVDRPVQFMVVLAGRYNLAEEKKDGVTVRVASYAMANKRATRKLTNLTEKIIGYYESFLGPFPFDEFNVIEINDLGWGQAPPGVMFITTEAFNPIGDPVNERFSQGINERFAHEIAHQYWGSVVKMPSVREQWITESFAEICAGLVVRDLRGKSDFAGLQSVWEARGRDATGVAPIPLANRIRNHASPSEAGRYRTYLLYAKGPWLLNDIRKKIGDQKFLSFLRSCQATMAWKFGTTGMVEKVLELLTREDWKPFFDANYWGTGMPK